MILFGLAFLCVLVVALVVVVKRVLREYKRSIWPQKGAANAVARFPVSIPSLAASSAIFQSR